MKKKIISSALIVTCFVDLYADNTLDDFESILGEASQIATQKSVNVDYMPSVVTVIDAQTYVDAGIQNVGEALGMLPGIQMQIGYLGQPITTIRGFKNPNSFISDKVKIMMDGVGINNEATGTAGFLMDFPMDLVDRIEVLRGPGSTVYGAGAIYGTVNIITKTGNEDKEESVYFGIGSYENMTTGGNFHTSIGDYKIFTDAYYTQNKKGIFDEESKDYNGDVQDKTDEEKQDFSIGLKVVNGGFEFLTRYKSSQYGNFYARKGDISPNNDKGHKDDYFLSQLSYNVDLNGYKLDTRLKYSYKESDITAYVETDVNKYAGFFNLVGIDMQDAFYIGENLVEQNFEAEAILTIPEIYSNSLTLGAGIRYADISTNKMFSNIEDTIAKNLTTIENSPNYQQFYDLIHEPLYWEDPANTKAYGKTTRTISYLNIQDLISINNKTDLVLGARVDYYSDMGAHFSSRAGLVYRANDELIFKVLYGSAFRAPTFTEKYTDAHILFYRYGDRELQEETVDTYEAEVIYMPNIYNKLSLNIYYSTLSNVIDLEEIDSIEGDPSTYPGYQNMKSRSSKGVEFEYFFNPRNEHNLYFNASYVEADYTIPIDGDSPTEIDQSMPDISKYMFKAMYIFKPTNSLSFGTTWQYYSQTTQTTLPWVVKYGRDVPVEKQSIFDETITYHFSASSQLRLTIKNLFNEEVRLPSYYYTQNGGVLREGRNFYLTYKYTF